MRNHLAVVLFSSLGLFACAGSTPEAKNEADPWKDFKGTYSATSADGAERADKGEPTKKSSKAKSAQAEKPKAEEKKASRGTVNGESLSSISVESLTDASKSALKGKLVSNSVVTGKQYELVQVQLKGATVQIFRPATSPSPNGPSVASPRSKSEELAKNDAGWYDDEADVFVSVNAGGKKAAAQKALASLVKH